MPLSYLHSSTVKGAAAHVAATLEEDIIFGRLAPGTRLVEDDLIRRFAEKRHTIRQALAALAQIGIVEKERNKGATVRRYSIVEVENIYAMRELLQGNAAECIKLPADPTVVRRLEHLYRKMDAQIAGNNQRALFYLNEEFHESLFAECGNPYLCDAIRQHAWLSHPIRSYVLGDPALAHRSHADHRAMIDAYKEGRRRDLVDLCRKHVRPAKEAYLSIYEGNDSIAARA
jgi:DNA-binding GntR family transcriptional regulator